MEEKLLKLLYDEHIMTEEQYQQALQRCEAYGENAEQVVERMGILSEEKFLAFLGEKFRLPVVEWENYVPDRSLLNLISEEVALKYTIFPFLMEPGKRQGKITLAVANPSNVAAVDDIAFMTGCTIKTRISSARAIREAIHVHYSGTEGTAEAIEGLAGAAERPAKQDFSPSGSEELDALLTEILQEAERTKEESVEDIAGADRDHPSMKFLLDVLQKTVQYGVSEIYIEPYGRKEQRVRVRQHGVLQEYAKIPAQLGEGLASRLRKILQQTGGTVSSKNGQKTRTGRFSTILSGGTPLDIVTNFYPTLSGEKVGLKIQNDSELLAFHELGISEKSLKTLNRIFAKPQGILLLISPPGQGKTTTLHTLLDKLWQGGNLVLSLEDELKATIPGVTQIPYASETSFQDWCSIISYHAPYALGLGQAEKPIMKRLAVEFASNSLVLTSLAGQSLEGGLCFFISTLLDDLDRHPSKEVLACLLDVMSGVIAQRLVRTICPNCKEQQSLSKQEREWLYRLAGKHEEIAVYAGTGCAECMETGYAGKTAVFEVMKIDKVFKTLFLQHYPSCISPVRDFYAEISTETFRNQAFQLIRDGITSPAEIRRMAL